MSSIAAKVYKLAKRKEKKNTLQQCQQCYSANILISHQITVLCFLWNNNTQVDLESLKPDLRSRSDFETDMLGSQTAL